MRQSKKTALLSIGFVAFLLAGFYDSLDAQQQEKVRNKLEKKMRHFRDDD